MAEEALDLFRAKLGEFEELIAKEHDLQPDDIRGALQELSKELHKTPDLVYLLEDQEIGMIAKGAMITTGIKQEMEEKAKKKAPRKKRITAKTAKDKPMEILSEDDILF